jgi:DNA polymerase I-like protein with 3'-5' exonuclease and polymerase domains
MFGKAYMDNLKLVDEDLFAKKRKIAKTLNFSIIYGVSAWKLSNDYEVSLKEAQSWIDDWQRANPNITKWLVNTRKKALEEGYVQIDKLGRKAWFSDHLLYTETNEFLQFLTDKDLWYLIPNHKAKELKSKYFKLKGRIERQAGNYIVQGSCSTITKLAQCRLFDKGISNILQVYDEILVKGDYAEELKESMEFAWNYFNKKVSMPLISEYSIMWKK